MEDGSLLNLPEFWGGGLGLVVGVIVWWSGAGNGCCLGWSCGVGLNLWRKPWPVISWLDDDDALRHRSPPWRCFYGVFLPHHQSLGENLALVWNERWRCCAPRPPWGHCFVEPYPCSNGRSWTLASRLCRPSCLARRSPFGFRYWFW